MRPDLDDFEELEEGSSPRSRAMSWVVLIVAVGGFAALAYYAYHSGSQSMRDGSVLVVDAEQGSIKATPDDAEGEQFANKDKTIYDAINPDIASEPQAEKLLPEPEEPVIPEPAVNKQADDAKPTNETTTFVNKTLTPKDEAIDPVDAQSMKQGAPKIAPEAKQAVVKPVEAPKKEVVKPEELKSEIPVEVKAAPVAAKPDPVVAKPVVAEVKKAPVASPSAPAMVNVTSTAPKAPVAASGDYKIQLGAVQSEAEARQLWSKITAKNGDVIKSGPIVVKAVLPNGTFYRLRASGYATADAAKAACAKLAARKQPCFFAGK